MGSDVELMLQAAQVLESYGPVATAEGYTAEDMASQGAQGFRDGYQAACRCGAAALREMERRQ